MSALSLLLTGLLFGAGLALSGLADPDVVVGFLDMFGSWDPTLVFVMLGAVVVHALAYRWVIRRDRPLFDTQFRLPTARNIDPKLILGSAVFGVGWGLGGTCPGTAFAALGSAALSASVWLVFAALGMAIGHFAHSPRAVAR